MEPLFPLLRFSLHITVLVGLVLLLNTAAALLRELAQRRYG
jgi:hypothetical protein